MGLKFDKVDDLDTMFAKFALDPDKIVEKKVEEVATKEDEEKRKQHMGIKEKSHKDQKIIK